jgi:hypothetical protein
VLEPCAFSDLNEKTVFSERHMESLEPVPRVLFIAPLILMPLLLILLKPPWRMILPVWLAGTFIQELVFGLYPWGAPLPARLMMVLYLYPFALFPLGIWSMILGILCWAIAVKMRWPLQLERSRQLLLGLLCGALIGAIFSFTVGQLEGLGPISGYAGRWLVWEGGGAISGAVDGVIVAASLRREDLPHARIWRWAYR